MQSRLASLLATRLPQKLLLEALHGYDVNMNQLSCLHCCEKCETSFSDQSSQYVNAWFCSTWLCKQRDVQIAVKGYCQMPLILSNALEPNALTAEQVNDLVIQYNVEWD